MAYIPDLASVVSFQSDPTKLLTHASVSGIVGTGNNSVIAVIQGSVATVGGSGGTQYLEGAVQSSVTGTAILFRANENSSVLSAVHPNNPLPTDLFVGSSIVSLANPMPIQPPASGVLPVIVPGSVASAQIGTQITSISGQVTVVSSLAGGIFPVSGSVAAVVTNNVTVVSSLAGGIFPVSGSVAAVVTNFPTTQNVSGSVVAFPTGNQSVSGTITASITGKVQIVDATGADMDLFKQGDNFAVGSDHGLMILGLTEGTPQKYQPLRVTSVISDGSPNEMVRLATTANLKAYNGTTWDMVRTGSTTGALLISQADRVVSSIVGNPSISGTVAATQQGAWTTSVVGGVSILGGNVGVTGTPSISGDVRIIGSVITVGGSGGTQYLEGAVQSSVTGNAIIFRVSDNSSVLNTVSPSKPLPVTGNASVTGTMSVLGTVPVTQSGAWTTSVVGTVATTQAGTWISSIVNTVPSSVIVGASAFGIFPISGNVGQTGTAITSLVSTVPSSVIVGASIFGLAPVNVTNTNLNVSGSVVAFQGTSPWVVQSIVGTYAEDAAHTSGDKGLFTLGVRNDTMASLVSADLDYGSNAIDSQGRTIIKPFVSEDATIISYTGSIVSTSVQLIQASAVGKRSYITDFWLSNTGATTTLVYFKDGSTSIIGHGIAPTGGGESSPGLSIPFKTAPSQDLVFTPLSATSVLYLTVKGYQAQ